MKLSFDDIKKALTDTRGVVPWSDSEIEEAFKQADLDGNGHIDYDEFLFIWDSKNAPPRRNSYAHRVKTSRSQSSFARPQPVDHPDLTPDNSSDRKERSERPARKVLQNASKPEG
mmetsp:Transcript_13172/g.21127  ORF Transcript_13172/g.21127 Transcript_13172/m.21127 type:complete len:115 (+) Transcript_13172:174-518(+)